MIKTTIHQDFFILLKEAWQDVTKNFWIYFFFLFIWASIFLLIMACVVYAYGFAIPTQFAYFINAGIGALLWLIIISIFFCSWFSISYLDLILSKEKSIAQSYIFGFPRFFAFFLLFLFIKLLIIGHSVFFLLPGVVLGIYFLFAPFIFVTEKCNIFQAMKKSMELVSGSFLLVLWYVIELLVIFGVLIFIPFLNILALLLFPMIMPTFFAKLFETLKKTHKEKKVKPKATLMASIFIALAGWIIALIFLTKLF